MLNFLRKWMSYSLFLGTNSKNGHSSSSEIQKKSNKNVKTYKDIKTIAINLWKINALYLDKNVDFDMIDGVEGYWKTQ